MKVGAAVIMAVFLAGCQHTRPTPAVSAPAIRAACGAIRPWAPDWQKRLATELRALPSGHVFRTLARDAIDARDAIRICRGERK